MNYPMHQADTEYNAELSIICESKIPDVARLGLLHGMDPQGIYEDILKMLPPNRRKCNDGEILAIINQALRPPGNQNR